MGKYIKKSKIASGALSIKDISHQTASGFRTRAAKNLALHRLRSHSTPPSVDADSFRYLQIRSRRLVKLPLLAETKKQQQKQLINSVGKRQTTNPRANSVSSEEPTTNLEEDCGSNLVKSESGCSLGEKGSELESGDRETTPCSLRRGSEEATQSVTSSNEIEDFFAFAEQQQQRCFAEKYNFDIVSENPLPGRYEWIKVVVP
ncbi:Cyclin-dependent kinase inhibitor 5 [Raphanus sativus]|uniref:Cyclin-dependent kinase inhibitor n=1 Tax=Raphanus sativus TaxID=3726 RepID=A0A9W3D3G1_RAPSA|nr:cyclin-dependent kinase inhibitor 5-like [Raphanus sativus]KAJ4865845.1 Cyclin-dependent kinase inhibitor 5 [Raphanus sativus]